MVTKKLIPPKVAKKLRFEIGLGFANIDINGVSQTLILIISILYIVRIDSIDIQ